jgi:hypothetical protein
MIVRAAAVCKLAAERSEAFRQSDGPAPNA